MPTKQFPHAGSHVGGVRIVTLNLWGRSGAWVERRSKLIAGFRAFQPDLVAFQKAIKSDEYDQVTERRLWPDCLIVKSNHPCLERLCF